MFWQSRVGKQIVWIKQVQNPKDYLYLLFSTSSTSLPLGSIHTCMTWRYNRKLGRIVLWPEQSGSMISFGLKLTVKISME